MDILPSSGPSHGVPIDHLDYHYIDECDKVKELEKILKVLRSGKEGKFPDLEDHCEKKLQQLDPNNRALRKEKPALKSRDLDKDEHTKLLEDLRDWAGQMHSADENLHHTNGKQDVDGLPPVRGVNTTLINKEEEKKPPKRVKPRSYKEWDKVDVEQELEKVDKEDEIKKAKVLRQNNSELPDQVDITGLTPREIELKADSEKNKGNEAFYAGDLSEALTYYNRSISLVETAACYNNRAMVYIKMKDWKNGVDDCKSVLDMEPDNIKAYLRRGVAYQGWEKFKEAKEDIYHVLSLEPQNKRAQKILGEITEQEEKVKDKKATKKGTKMIIEEVDGENEVEMTEEPKEEPKKRGRRMVIEEVDGEEEEEVKEAERVSEEINKLKEDLERVNKLQKSLDDAQATYTKDVEKDEEKNEKEEKTETETTAESTEQEKTEENKDASHDQVEENNREEEDENEKTEEATEEVKEHKRPVYPVPVLPPAVEKLKSDGNTLFKNGGYADSMVKYTSAIKRLEQEKDVDHRVSLSRLYSNRAACQLKNGNSKACIEDCTTSLSLLPHAIKPILRRAQAYEHLERYRHAYVDYKHAQSIDSNMDVAYLGSSRCSKHLQELDGREWRERLPEMTHALPYDIPEIIEGDGVATTAPPPPQPTKPVVPPTEKVSKCPASGASRQNIDTTSASADDMAKCPFMKNKTNAIKKEDFKMPNVLSDEELYDQCKNRGNDFVKKGEYYVAIGCYDKCISMNASHAVAYTNRALCYLKTNQPDKALDDCNIVLEVQPTNAKALYRRALARKAIKDYLHSLEDLSKLLELEPKNSAAIKELGEVKEHYREYLKNLSKSRSDAAKKAEQKSRAPPKAQKEKQRKRMDITEVDTLEEEVKNAVNSLEEVKAKLEKSSENKTKLIQELSETQAKIDTIKSTLNNSGIESPQKSNGKIEETKTQEDTTSNKKGKKKKRKKSANAQPTLSSLKIPEAIKSPYEFMQAWTSVKSSHNVEPHSQILEQITPEELPDLLTNKLDGDMLTTVIKSCQRYIVPKDNQKAYDILFNLTKVSRFNMVAMFMSENDKKVLRDTLQGLPGKCDLRELRKAYGLKV